MAARGLRILAFVLVLALLLRPSPAGAVAVYGADSAMEATIASVLDCLTDEERSAVAAVHVADPDGFLPLLGVPLPRPTGTEWGGAWANPGAPGTVVLLPLSPAQQMSAVIHEVSHLVANVRSGSINHGDVWAAVAVDLWVRCAV